jgi:osmotically-inducible protein OsmY
MAGPMSTDPDPFLAEHIHEALSRDERVNAPELRVTVEHGFIHVDGVVATDDRKHAIADVVGERWGDLTLDDRTTVADFPHDGRIEVV